MAKYSYPAIFHADKETGGYWVEFPDWSKVNYCACTDGENYKQARYMAEDLLGLICWDQENEHKECPPSGKLEDYFEIGSLPGNSVIMIEADTDAYRQIMRFNDNRSQHYRYQQIRKAVERYKKWD